MSRHFDIDLARGVARELALARVLLGGREKVEHKRDYLCARTGNVALEYETSELPNGQGARKKSGPLCSVGTHWLALEYAQDHRLIVPLDTAKELARAAINAGRHKWIGDSNRFHNALVPVKWFLAGTAAEAMTERNLEQVVERWMDILPTETQAQDYTKTGTFTPDAQGWTT